MFKNIIFDWSGVVKDALNSGFWIVNNMMKAYGKDELSIDEFKSNWEQPYMKFWEKYVPGLDIEDEQKLFYELINSAECPKSADYPGMVDLIKKAKNKGVFMTVVSSDFPRTLLPEIKEYGLENIFSNVITNVNDKTDSVEKIIKENNLKKGETILIGDSNHEIEIAKKIGIKIISVTWGFSTKEKLKKLNPDYLIDHVGELEKILL